MAERNLDDVLSRLKSIGNREEERKAEQTTPRRERRTSPLFATSVEGATAAATDIQVEETRIYQLLTDTSLESDDKIQALTDLLVLNYEDQENAAQFASLAEVRVIIAALIEDFTEQSSASIRMTQDNPLSALTENIRAVFENYHRLVAGRADLKEKLQIIQAVIEKSGGSELDLLQALSDAQSKRNEKDALVQRKQEAEALLNTASDNMETVNTRAQAVAEELAEIGEPTMGLFMNREQRARRSELQQEERALTRQEAVAREELERVTHQFEEADRALSTFLGDDYDIYEQILEILDIGNDEFKDVLSRVAEQTLQYIEDTRNSLTGVREQLSKLLDDVRASSDVSFNTNEKIVILQKALMAVQDRNAAGFEAFKAKTTAPKVVEGLADLGELEQRKIYDRATQFTSDMQRSLTSTTEISVNVATHHTTLQQMRTDLEEGVNRADSQLLKAVSTAAATGQTMLQRIQRLAAMAQGIVAGSTYQAELAETFNSVVGDFETSLQAQLQRNNDISGFAQLASDLTEALNARNEATVVLAAEQAQIVERLADNVEKLHQANQAVQEIDTTIASESMARRAAASNSES